MIARGEWDSAVSRTRYDPAKLTEDEAIGAIGFYDQPAAILAQPKEPLHKFSIRIETG